MGTREGERLAVVGGYRRAALALDASSTAEDTQVEAGSGERRACQSRERERHCGRKETDERRRRRLVGRWRPCRWRRGRRAGQSRERERQ